MADRPRRRRRRPLLVVLVVVLLVVVGIGVWSDVEARNWYAFTPGTAPEITTSPSCRLTSSGALALDGGGGPCARLVIASGHGHEIDGKLLMVDVLVGKATPLQWLGREVGLLDTFSKGSQLVASAAVLGSTPASQLDCQDLQYMQSAQSVAPLVALGRLGYDVGATNLGARVFQVLSGTAASRAGVRCDDLITAVGSHVVRTDADLSSALAGLHPGQRAEITVERPGSHGHTTKVTVAVTLTGVPAMPGLTTADPHKAFLGVQLTTDTVYHLPFALSAEVGDIGGPSAGLALTLGFLDALSGGHLTGGKVVAATGTISPNGAVGEIGGVYQKAVAVQRAGAQLFLVPSTADAHTAAQAAPGLKVEVVHSLTQALSALAAIGGTVPAAPTTH